MIEEPNPYNPKYRIQSHGYEAYAKDLRAWGDALKARVAELEAFIQENVECNCTPVRVCPRCSIATKP